MPVLALQGLAERLADAAGPWQSLHADSLAVSATVAFAHLGALLVGGGMAIAADRHTLRAAGGSADDRERHLADLSRLHAIVLGALAVIALSGVAMFLADVEEFWGSATFWVKMGLVALLLANGALMTRTERALRRAPAPATWGRLRVHAIASLALWMGITLGGVLLQGG